MSRLKNDFLLLANVDIINFFIFERPEWYKYSNYTQTVHSALDQ